MLAAIISKLGAECYDSEGKKNERDNMLNALLLS
jgi:hypothetical protein